MAASPIGMRLPEVNEARPQREHENGPRDEERAARRCAPAHAASRGASATTTHHRIAAAANGMKVSG